jgi:hypothetical protein
LLDLALGVAVAMALTRWLASLLFNVSPTDALVSALLLFAALMAYWIPALRQRRLTR